MQIPWLKLGVAIAVIRHRPKELSSREYAENLQADFLLAQSHLQDRYQQARIQIAQLEERLAISSSCASSSTQLHPSGLPQHVEIPSLLLCGSTDTFLTPPSSSKTMVAKDADSSIQPRTIGHHSYQGMTQGIETLDGYGEVSWMENSKFIHSTLTLQRLACHGFNTETKDVARHHIRSLSESVSRDLMAVSELCMCQAAESVVALLHKFTWLEEHTEFMQEVCLLVEMVIRKLVESPKCGQCQNRRQKESCMKMLLVFMKGQSVALRLSILDSLVEAWETFCHMLRSCQRAGVMVDSDEYENSYFVMRCLDQIMTMWQQDCQLQPVPLRDIQTRLHNSVLHLMDGFPLITHAVWRVTSLIESILHNR